MMSEAILSPVKPAHRVPGVSWPTDLLALALFLAFGIVGPLHSFTIGQGLPGDLGDSRLNLTVLEFFNRTLIATLHGQPASFVNAPFFYPWPRVTNFADTLWGDAEVYAVFRALGLGQLASFRAWFVAASVLTYVAAFISFRQFGLRAWGAAAGAFLFTFCLPMAAQFNHVQLVYRLWIPPAVLALHRFLTRQSVRAGAACVLFLGLQLAVSIYLGLFLCLLLAAYALALCLVARHHVFSLRWTALRAASTAELVMAGAMLIAGLAVIAVVAIPYREVQAMYGFVRPWPDVASQLPHLGSYLLTGISFLWPDLTGTLRYALVWEQQLFPGAASVVAVGWFAVSRRARLHQPLAAPMLMAAAIVVAITLNLHGHTLYRLIYQLPGFVAIREVARVILVVMLPVAVLFGLLIDDLADTARRGPIRYAMAVALSALLVAECSLIRVPASAPQDWRARTAALEAELPKPPPPHAILAVATPPGSAVGFWPWVIVQTDAQLVAISLGIPTLNGYSGNLPNGWKTMSMCADVAHDIRAGRHFRAEHGLPAETISPDQLVLVGFGTCGLAGLGDDAPLALGHTYHFAPGAAGNAFPGGGFSDPESWGRWTDGKNAFLYFSLAKAPHGPVTLVVDATSLSPAPDQKQVVTVLANNRGCGPLVVTQTAPRAEVVCPDGALHGGNNVLRLRIAAPTRPRDLGINDDSRRLGVGLRALVLQVATDGPGK